MQLTKVGEAFELIQAALDEARRETCWSRSHLSTQFTARSKIDSGKMGGKVGASIAGELQ